MSPVLKLKNDDQERELEFEVEYQLSLTVEQRFRMMFQKSREIAEILVRNGHRKPFEMKKAAGREKDKEDLRVLEKLKEKI
jgi:hypothetical protein